MFYYLGSSPNFQIEMSKQQVHLGKQEKHSGKIKLRMDTIFMGFIEVYDIHRHFFANCAENIFLELFQDISKLSSKTPVLWSSELLIFMLNGQLNFLRINYRFQKITFSFVKISGCISLIIGEKHGIHTSNFK